MASSSPRPPENPVKPLDFNDVLDNKPPEKIINESNGNIQQKAKTIDVNSNMKASVETRRRPVSLPPGDLNARTTRKRASCYQDVEEALSSLLWQPYEYRTNSDSSDTISTLSLSTGSSNASLSYEYAAIGKLLHSFTDEFNAATLSDPKLVSNLAAVGGNQPESRVRSRGQNTDLALSQNYLASSRVRGTVGVCDSDAVTVSAMKVEISDSDMNIVGLPATPRNSDINHPRSVSDFGFRQNAVSVQHVRASSETANVSNDTHILHTRQDSQQNRVPPLPNVSNVNVNFYRAVPINVVSNVPTIQCVNTVENPAGNNISNVHIVQAMPQTNTQNVIVQQPILPAQNLTQPQNVTEIRTRTFTSTEAQTDDTTVGNIVPNREQRRRERRERRHQRRINNHPHPIQSPQTHTQIHTQTGPNISQNISQNHPNPSQNFQPNDRLPDLLNSHLPPPYSTLPSGMPPPIALGVPPPSMVPFPPGVVPVVQPPQAVPVPVPVAQHSGFRFPVLNGSGFRRCRSRLGPRYSAEDHQPKSCCGFLVSRPGSLRWFIALIALVAVCCVLVGTVLGAMRPAGRDHLTVSLLMIGVGIVLVTVSGVAWRLTSHDAPSCRAMLGLDTSDTGDICARRFVPRLPPSYGRPHHPYAAMIYPEFQYRPPPPSYQASMQEYRLRLLLLDRAGDRGGREQVQGVVSPPPTYRSHAGSLLRAPLSNRRDATQSEYSCPPSYRSRSSSNRQPSINPTTHSREQSLSLSESNQDGSVVNVVNILSNQEEEIALENMTLDSLKVAPENEIPPLRMLLKSGSGSEIENKEGNLVTIVQKADQNPVIVTVSGSQMSTANPEVGSSREIPSEMEILAHL